MTARSAAGRARLKLASVICLLLIPILLLSFFLFQRTYAEIEAARQEVVGADYADALLGVYLALAQSDERAVTRALAIFQAQRKKADALLDHVPTRGVTAVPR